MVTHEVDEMHKGYMKTIPTDEEDVVYIQVFKDKDQRNLRRDELQKICEFMPREVSGDVVKEMILGKLSKRCSIGSPTKIRK